MKTAVGSDHAGYDLKQIIVNLLEDMRLDFRDFGVPSPSPADYPDIGAQVAEAVANGEFDRGILVCGTGIGMSITANKIPGIRAALCSDEHCAVMSREHNNANILVLGSRVIDQETAVRIAKVWLETEFPDEDRHARRIRKISEIEERYNGGRS